MDNPESNKPLTPPSDDVPAKAPYVSPTLRRYGPIRDLTAGGVGSRPEGGSSAMNKRP